MGFASRLIEVGALSGLVLKATLASLLGIVLLVMFIVARRAYRARYFRRLNERTYALRAAWDEIIAGRIPAVSWRLKPLDCKIVESILFDSIEIAAPDRLPELLACLRSSGLLDQRIFEARTARGWKRRAALVALRTHSRARSRSRTGGSAGLALRGNPHCRGSRAGAHRARRSRHTAAGTASCGTTSRARAHS